MRGCAGPLMAVSDVNADSGRKDCGVKGARVFSQYADGRADGMPVGYWAVGLIMTIQPPSASGSMSDW
jgi:hypothetical protein